MCEECNEPSGLYLAYVNKPGGRRWRPARTLAAAPAGDRYAVAPVPVTTQDGRPFVSARTTGLPPAHDSLKSTGTNTRKGA